MGTRSLNPSRLLSRLVRQLRTNATAPARCAVAPDTLSQLIASSHHKIIAFDLFDTLVCRSVAPEHTKLLAADRLVRELGLLMAEAEEVYALRRGIEARLCREASDRWGELEFRFDDMVRHLWTALVEARHAPASLPLKSFMEVAKACELAVEREVLMPVPAAIEALRKAVAIGKRCVLLSDFYLPAEDVVALVAPFDIPEHFELILVSCDQMASKRSGRLYVHLLEKLGVPPGDVLMIGDNPHSDIAMAKCLGLSAIHVVDRGQQAHYRPTKVRLNSIGAFRGVVATALKQQQYDIPNFRCLAAPLLLFTERLFAVARARGYRDLFFISREGQVLERLFNIYQDALGLSGGRRIRTHYLLASRRACFVASLKPVESEDFQGLFHQYRRISARDFLRSLRFENVEKAMIAEEAGCDLDRVEEDFPTSATFAAILATQRFRRRYEAIRRDQQSKLLAYIRQFGVSFAEHPLVVVDVGWKGSIQDYLCDALPAEISIEGLYLGLVAAPRNAERKHGLLFSCVGRPSRDFVIYNESRSLFEIVLCADHGSALNYRVDEEGRVVVDCDDDSSELSFIQRRIAPVTLDVVDAFRSLCSARLRHIVRSTVWISLVAELHRELVFFPTEEQRAWLAGIRHSENFGIYTHSVIGPSGRLPFRERARFLCRLAREPRRTLQNSFWPAYTLRHYGGPLLASLYAYVRIWQNAARGRSENGQPTVPWKSTTPQYS